MNENKALETPATSQPAPQGMPISIHTTHGPLHGLLTLQPDACGLVVLIHAGAVPGAHDEALASRLRQDGLATLVIDLLTHQEERFADVHNNIPLLAKRLLDCLTLIKRQMENEELPHLPIALSAADTTSPVAIRVAALRDHDIAAVVCRGGLIDLAGALYLRSLASPLLVLVGDADRTVVASNQRALQEIHCNKMLAIIPDTASTFDSLPAFSLVAQKVAHWLGEYCCQQTARDSPRAGG